jgi:hypothetical protein
MFLQIFYTAALETIPHKLTKILEQTNDCLMSKLNFCTLVATIQYSTQHNQNSLVIIYTNIPPQTQNHFNPWSLTKTVNISNILTQVHQSETWR